MSYNMPYGTGINYMQPLQIQTPPIQPQQQHVERVHGEAGVDRYPMAPNSDVLLLDETAPMIWFVQTDAAGYKTKHPYDITPHENKEEPDVNEFDKKISALDERLKTLEEALK